MTSKNKPNAHATRFVPETFDADYYQRFYADRDTQAVSTEEQQRQAQFVAAYLNYLELPINNILDLGCGIGQMLNAFGAAFPEADCRGVEFSTYLCEELGWEQGSVVDYAGAPADLVVCNDVLGYLDQDACQDALANLARLSCSALYLSVLTEEDLPVCDTALTDMRQQLRPVAWYRKQLQQNFVAVGGGLFLRQPLQAAIWQLERT
ncbi:MAG: class I SAM-dependent methyltransferase [Pseudomonadota bacterium]